MPRSGKKMSFCITIMSLLLLMTSTAHAYIDPGAGSMFLQAVIAGIAACSVSVGMSWKRIRAFFQRSATKKSEQHDDADGK